LPKGRGDGTGRAEQWRRPGLFPGFPGEPVAPHWCPRAARRQPKSRAAVRACRGHVCRFVTSLTSHPTRNTALQAAALAAERILCLHRIFSARGPHRGRTRARRVTAVSCSRTPTARSASGMEQRRQTGTFPACAELRTDPHRIRRRPAQWSQTRRCVVNATVRLSGSASRLGA